MKRLFLVVMMALGLAGGAHASLVGRDISGNVVLGSDARAVFLYDTVLDITWLRDANYAKTSGYSPPLGALGWAQAKTWVSSLAVGSFSGWRLPAMATSPNATFSPEGGTDHGWNVRTKSGDPTQYEPGQTVYSEMAHLYYITLGNVPLCNQPDGCYGFPSITGNPVNTGDFKNMDYAYWSDRENNQNSAYIFTLRTGLQGPVLTQFSSAQILLVRPGDVLATPIPAAAWLMLSGIGALGAAARRRKSVP